MAKFLTTRFGQGQMAKEVKAKEEEADSGVLVLLRDLRSESSAVRERTTDNLRLYVGQQARDMSPDQFKKLLNVMTETIFEMITSAEVQNRIAGTHAIDCLIDVEFEQSSARTKLTRMSNYLRQVLESEEAVVLKLAASTLGKLVRVEGTVTAEIVDEEMKKALVWLSPQQQLGESRRQAAVLILREMAVNAPSLFYVHVSTFFDRIWTALQDSRLDIRLGAAEALGAALELTASRKTRQRSQWHDGLWQLALSGLKGQTMESVHGAIVVVAELLKHAKEFMVTRYKLVCEAVLKQKDFVPKGRYTASDAGLVRRTVMEMIPIMGGFLPEMFSTHYCRVCVEYLLSFVSSKDEDDRATAFAAIGALGHHVGDRIGNFMTKFLDAFGSAISSRRTYCNAAVLCLADLVSVGGKDIVAQAEAHVSLKNLMVNASLDAELMEALQQIGKSVPSFLLSIQLGLIKMIAFIITKKNYTIKLIQVSDKKPRNKDKEMHEKAEQFNYSTSMNAASFDEETILLALQTLGAFDVDKELVLAFTRDVIAGFLDHDNPLIRKEAAITCAKIVRPVEKKISPMASAVINQVIEKLLLVGIADTEPSLRITVLSCLDSQFDVYLAEPDNLRSLFIALNDEIFEMRMLAIQMIGRLTIRNPAYVMPSMRKTLVQLLTELEFTGVSGNKEESASLLGHLISSSQELIRPYAKPIVKALLPKLNDENARVASTVLETLGALSTVAGDIMEQHLPRLMPIIIDSLQDQSSTRKRHIALKALGQFVQSTGRAITPFDEYPRLMDILLGMVKSERLPTMRKELLKVLGILGALDPYRYKINQSGRLHDLFDDAEELDILTTIAPSSTEYAPTAAVIALMRVLGDPSLNVHHTLVIKALIQILSNLPHDSREPLVPLFMPPFLHLVRTSETHLTVGLLENLVELVGLVREHMHNYLGQVFELIKEYWNTETTNLMSVLSLIELISMELGDIFKVYLPDLIPQMLAILHADLNDDWEATIQVLHTLEIVGKHLDDYIHLVVPAIVRLMEVSYCPIEVRKAAIVALGRLSFVLNLEDYASRMSHPLARILETQVALRDAALDTLCALVYELGTNYAILVPIINKVLLRCSITHAFYDNLVAKLLNNVPLTDPPADFLERVKGSSVDRASKAANLQQGSLRVKETRVNQQALRQAWKTSNRQTKEDWIDWMRKLSVELLRNSSSPVLRSCLSLAQVYHPLASELFNPAFLSCWNGIDDQFRDQLVQSLKNALGSTGIPPEIMQIILNCFEWMERDGGKRMINIQNMGAFGEKCHAYAKALHYKEIEFRESPTIESDIIEALITINNQVQQPEAAVGILTYAQKNQEIPFSASWYEKLRRWHDALEVYQQGGGLDPTEAVLGQIRCYSSLSDWDKVITVSQEAWKQEELRPCIAPLAAAASWHVADWEKMGVYVKELGDGFDGSFYRAILAIQEESFQKAQKFIDGARQQLDNELTVLVGESYNRAYDEIVKVQQLSELEEIIIYKQAKDATKKTAIIRMWERRLDGVQRNVDVWDDILSVRSLVLSPKEEPDMWLKYSSLCRKSRTLPTARQILVSLFPKDVTKLKNGKTPKGTPPRIVYGYLQQLWAEGEKQVAYDGMVNFSKTLKDNPVLMARCQLRLGKWRRAREDHLDESAIPSMINSFKAATVYNSSWYKAWYEWAFINFEILSLYDQQGKSQAELSTHLIAAIDGFVQSIALSPGQSLQDTLRLLTLWFKYGDDVQAIAALKKGFEKISVDNWLQVVPQIIARIHSQSQKIRNLIQHLLIMVGRAHPQALVYPMTVASKSQDSHPSQSDATNVILDDMKQHSALLVEQAEQVSHELIRISIVWHEMWHEALEEASRFYFNNSDPDAMIARLKEMHELMAAGPETLREVAFYQTFGRDLEEAREWSIRFLRTRSTVDINQAWDLYSGVFKRIVKLLPNMKSFDLQYVSPYLLGARDLALAVPGTYRANAPVVCIKSFGSKLKVFSSKQRPRHTTISGSDDKTYSFLLKGHEDLRQDERVMQLFGLVNTLLANDPDTSKNHLMITRYSVIPLSPNSGLIGWVPNCDTLLKLVQDYREEKGIVLRYEHNRIYKLVTQKEYDALALIQKVEAFEFALNGECDGQDINKVLWLKSRNSESWLDRRTTYTRSLAMMSIVGYILGLGDRHPSNLMLDKINGKIVHIDFGDCFEVAMQREKYPEKIPFRLTRMLIYAMEASGIEGNFRCTCENVMRVLRDHKESVMAVLEAFVHDPLLNWRLLNTNKDMTHDDKDDGDDSETSESESSKAVDLEIPESDTSLHPSILSGKTSFQADPDAAMPEVLNEKAVTVIARVKEKLTGTDFKPDVKLEVADQVAKLIEQATCHENLCQGYFGWCPFW